MLLSSPALLISVTLVLSNALFITVTAASNHSVLSPARHISPFARNRNRAASLPANWALVGCFSDATSNRALASYSTTSSSNTPAWCMSTCLSKGYSLAGVEFAQECYCSNSVVSSSNPSTGISQSASSCSTKCSGDSSQICGGGNLINIYTYTAPLPSGWSAIGCFTDDTNNRALASSNTVFSTTSTPALCVSTCSGKGYKYAGVEYGQECWCSNTLTTSSSTGMSVTSSQCNMACTGNAYTTCGAGGRIQIYQSAGASTTSLTTTSTTKTTSTSTSSSTSSTPSTTSTTSTTSTSLPTTTTTSTSTSTSSTATTSTVTTTTTSTASTSTSTSSSSPSWTKVGCYQDANTRALASYSTTSSSLTITSCQAICSGQGYTFAGVEYSTQCYCGNGITTPSTSLAESNCGMACGGDSTQSCGGSWAIEIYSLSGTSKTSTATTSSATSTSTSTATTTTVTTSSVTTTSTSSASTSTSTGISWAKLGCYQDANTRALAGYTTTVSTLTIASCQAICIAQGYAFAGVEYSTQCYCGSSITKPSTSLAESNCAMPCGGDSTQLCGGSWALEIYQATSGSSSTVSSTSTVATTTTTTSASSTTSSAAPTWTPLGCFTDANSRALNGPNIITTQNTPAWCQAHCSSLGYTLAGVESGQECWCASSLSYSGGAGQPQAASNCQQACTGDASQTCGGGWSLSLYASPAYTAASQSSWKLKDLWSGNSFFNGWSFANYNDPTHGIVTYQTQSTAQSMGLVSINGAGNAIMAVETTPVVAQNRSSIRIQTNNQYNSGIFVIDAVHMPVACGVWPAFWTVGPVNWPTNGEIDIIEGVHTSTQNQMSVHTAPGCTMPSNYGATAQLTGSGSNALNCDAAATGNTGCGLRSSQANNYGAPYNANGGGVHIMKWDSTGISIWFFPRGAIPSDVTLGTPQPSTWGTPAGNYPASTCNPSQFFKNHVVVFDTTLCGDWAGASSSWNTASAGQSQSCAASTGYSTCAAYVRANGAAMAQAYWEVKSVTVYQ